jgi:hypothetical protein
LNTPISAQGHEPLRQRLTTLNYEVPVWVNKSGEWQLAGIQFSPLAEG